MLIYVYKHIRGLLDRGIDYEKRKLTTRDPN